MKKLFGGRVALLLASAILVAATAASSASAAVVVGQNASAVTPPTPCEFASPFDELQSAVVSGTSYTIPVSGAITSWSTFADLVSGQQMTLKVFRPLGGTSYLVVAQETRSLTSGVLNTFPASIPVQAGDILGESAPPGVKTPCNFETGLAGDVIFYKEGSVGVGGTANLNETETGYRLNISATVLPPPAITAISPAKGSVKGGTSVTVTGGNFANVTAVAFGAAPAKSFTVSSEGQLTAVAPASKTLSKVPVTVTTAAGSASSTQVFAYQGCKVPQLKGKKLKAAKKKLKKSGCKLGAVKKQGGATSATGKVKKQSPKPGKILAPGSKVKVTLTD